MSEDRSYYAARAIEERRLAMAAADGRVRRAHLEMAAKYALLAGEDLDRLAVRPQEQRTA